MRKVVLVLFLGLAVAGGAQGSNPTLSAGGVGPPIQHDPGDRPDEFWSEPPDVNGLIVSSEIINDVGLESEIANDFVFLHDFQMMAARWWGGYYQGNGCGDVGYGTNWNIRFYEDGGCVPGNVIYEQLAGNAHELSIGCQGGFYPLFEYWVGVAFTAVGGSIYWFGAQCSGHSFPPQVGRLASMGVVNCESVFKSAFFAFPDWVAAIDVFGVDVDFSQQFEDIEGAPSDWGACCIGDQGECRTLLGESACEELGGVWQGYGVPCTPNRCDVTPVQSTTWGRIKGQFR
jgi:hypothetical protein